MVGCDSCNNGEPTIRLDFGNVTAGDTAERELRVENLGTSALEFSINPANPMNRNAMFEWEDPVESLLPVDDDTVKVFFKPPLGTPLSRQTDTLLVSHNDPGGRSVRVILTAQAIQN